MTKTANARRAIRPRSVSYTKSFEKSWQRYNNAGKRDMSVVVKVMQLIFSNQNLPEAYLDHALKGSEWKGARELHIGGDFLLVYKTDDAQNVVTFIDLGTHSELFG